MFDITRPDITLTIDPNGVIQSVSPSETLAEESLEQWRGRPWGETVDPTVGAMVAKLMKDGGGSGDLSCFKVLQTLPSGREVPIEYTTISLGKRAGFVAIGRNLQVISDLQARLNLAQQARERDYWKIREIETRYRLLFEASNEIVVLVRVANLRIVEANLAATRALGLLPGAEFFPDLLARDRKSFDAMLDAVRAHGRAPGIVLHLGPGADPWSLRASLMNTDGGSFYLFQIASVGAAGTPVLQDPYPAESIIQRLPDGFAVVDGGGLIRRANHTFLDLVQMGEEAAVLGQPMKRWLSRPGADLAALLALVQSQGSVRMLTTTLYGELGANTDVEVSAVGNRDIRPDYIGLILRDVTARARADAAQGGDLTPSLGEETFSLERLVKIATEAIERRTIKAALERSEGSRTIAARKLGLSRQSLHTKLNKYKVAENP